MAEFHKPGERVLRSGIYKAIHDPEHALEQLVTCIFGNSFPLCNGCGENVRFMLHAYAKDVQSDDNFK
jgi:hypothetical protein